MRHECNTSETRATPVGYNCDTSATRMTLMKHECYMNDTSAVRVKKKLILITARVKTNFHTPIFTIWQVKDYRERNNFTLSTNFGNASFPCQNEFEKCTTKTELCRGRSYIKKLYTKL